MEPEGSVLWDHSSGEDRSWEDSEQVCSRGQYKDKSMCQVSSYLEDDEVVPGDSRPLWVMILHYRNWGAGPSSKVRREWHKSARQVRPESQFLASAGPEVIRNETDRRSIM